MIQRNGTGWAAKAAPTRLIAALPAAINMLLTISVHYWNVRSGHSVRARGRHRIVPVTAFGFPRSGAISMSVDNVRPELNLLTAFTLTIAVAFAAALPMALAIIWVCS
jgi:hypothetical protein